MLVEPFRSLVAPGLVGSEFNSDSGISDLNSDRIELFVEPSRT